MEIFQRLCDSYRAHAVPRARLVSGLAKLLRRLTTSTTAPATPLLDLSRRLAASKLLGGSEPGALEALELLLNAILNHSEAPEAPTAVMLVHKLRRTRWLLPQRSGEQSAVLPRSDLNDEQLRLRQVAQNLSPDALVGTPRIFGRPLGTGDVHVDILMTLQFQNSFRIRPISF